MYMNIIIICVLSIAALGRTQEFEISPECREQFIRQGNLRDRCARRLSVGNNFFHVLNTTVIGFSGNDNDLPAVEAVFTEYCGVARNMMDCFKVLEDVSVDCRKQIPYRQMKLILFNVVNSLIEYACENDADILKKLLPHDGFKYFLYNDVFGSCIPADRDFLTIDGFCLSLDKALSCIELTVADHPNKDIIEIASEIANRFKAGANCVD